MRDLLKKHFGFDDFLPLQEEIISSVLKGRDTLVLMPTGGGKSLCYQLPALRLDGLTLVISPLIALMKDQVDALKANGIAAGFVNSALTRSEIRRVEDQVRRGSLKILYVAPERLALPEFRNFLEPLRIGLVAVGRGPLYLRVGSRLPAGLPPPRQPASRSVRSSLHCLDRHCHQTGPPGHRAAARTETACKIHCQLQPRQPQLRGAAET